MADPVIDEIKARVDIVDLISQTVQLNKAGRYLKGLCPFHGEKTPSFIVYPDQGRYHCFGCGKSGDAFTWVQETEHLDFGETLRKLADRAGVRLPERSEREPDPQAQAAADALTESAAWYHDQLIRSPEAEGARQYLVRRGVKAETVRQFALGWAPASWEGLVTHLRKQGVPNEQLIEAGLAREGERGLRDYFRGRLMFPIRDPEGKVRGFGARTLGDDQPKYLNSPQTPFFDKSATLYGLDLARQSIRKDGVAVIVEGYMDAVVPYQEGFTNVVASLGTALTEQQLALLKRYASTIILALDSDAAGQAATLRGLEVARLALGEAHRPVPGRISRTGFLQTSTVQIKIAVLSGGKDPDEIVREDPALWHRLLDAAVPMVDHKLNVELQRVDHRDPQSKSAAIQELARFLVQVPDPIEWSHYVDVIAQRLRVDMRAVKTEVDRAARATRRQERERASSDRSLPLDRTSSELGPAKSEKNLSPRPSSDREARAGHSPAAPSPATTLSTAPTPTAAGEDDVAETSLISLLVSFPALVRRLPTQLPPEEFQRPEYRELYRAVLRHSQGGSPSTGTLLAAEWPGATSEARASAVPARLGERVSANAPTSASLPDEDRLRVALDPSLQATYDDLLAIAKRRPPQTPSQQAAALSDMIRRVRERNLHARMLEAQYLLSEAQSDDERNRLMQQVARLSSSLLRIQLERSRASLYTSPTA
ncbi:MAG TPA: DNA primase [Chloroflexota bacterium]|nr:DNA primase [Chloroflexota bacterium]